MNSVGEQYVDEAEATPEASAEMSNPDFFGDFLEDFLEDPDKQEQKEATRTYLIDYYGDQQFQYMQHTGTITAILDVCPPVRDMLVQGPQAIIEFVDGYKIENKVEDENDEDESDESEDPFSIRTQPSEKKEPDTPKPEQKEAAKPEKPANTPSPEKRTEEPVAKEGTEHPLPSSVKPKNQEAKKAAKEVPSKKEKTEKVGEVEKVGEAESVVSQKSEPLPKPVLENETAPKVEAEKDEQAAVMSEEIIIQVREEVEPTKPENETVDSPTEPASLFEQVVLHEQADEVEIEADSPIDIAGAEPAPIIELAAEQTVEKVAEEATEEVEATQELESAHEVTYIERWAEAAQQEAPLEVLFETMVEDVLASLEQEDDREDEEEGEFEGADGDAFDAPNISTSLETETEAEEPVEVPLELENLEDPENTEPSLPHPELQSLLGAVASVRESVDRLYQAKTKEECATHIEQITIELSVILRGLGYEAPENIIREYLRTHSPEQLRQLIERLEAALRQATRQDVRRRRAGHVHVRHARVSKFVTFVMSALAVQKADYVDV